MNKNNFKGRQSHRNKHSYQRRGTNRRTGANTRMNNMDCEPPDSDKSTGFEGFENSFSSSKIYDNTSVNDDADPCERNLFKLCGKDTEESIKEISLVSSRNSKPIEMLCNFTSEEQLLKNFDANSKRNVDIPSNLCSTDPSEGISAIRNLSAKLESLKQNIDPSAVINDCRLKVISMTESCTAIHGKKIVNVSSQIPKTDGKDKIVLEQHLANMKLQHKSFQQFVQQIFIDLSDLYGLSDIDEILNRTKEITHRVEVECKRFSKTLPAYALKTEVEMALQKGQVTVISCDAVYFGNTVIPLLIQDMFNSGIIASCEVNDILAVNSAKNCSSLTDQKLGNLVGYEVGKESIASKFTKIMYTTVQELFSNSLKDPLFSRFSCVVLNEFFHRSIEADILLASLRECLSTRKDLKLILLVSVDETALSVEKYFSKITGATLVRTENLTLPVQVIWKEAPCNSEDDFVTEAADICIAVHVLNGEGNILVFLPSNEDALEASALTVSKLLEYSFKDAECVHVSEKIKGKKALQILEQKQDVRSIFFTHDGFEAMMFPDVRYVIDSGRIKEICFDSQKKLEVQRTSFISRSRAKIRKNCGGRFVSGVCYRMYSKENYRKNMARNELPELLTKSPLNSMIKIFQYKPDTALTVEFMEPFSKQVQENALKSLRSLGALKNGKLTLLGERIIKLPFLPKYSKLIILGIQWGFPFEAIVVVSLFLVKGYFFKYKNTEEFKKTVDAAKLHFLINDSDTLTFLNIYKQWTENGFSESWCTDNCIEFTFLENVHAKVNEVCDIVYKNMDAKGIDKFSDDFKWNSLQEALFECFIDNLCVYTGHFLSGYRSLTAQCIVFLHPSNSIPRKENLPEFLVYNRCISKSRNFITHTTSVPEAFVTEALKSGLLEIKHHDLFERKLVPCVIDCVGDMVIKHVFKKENLRGLEEQMKNKTKSELIVIEPSVEKGNVTLYALPDSIQKAEEVMRKFLRENIEHFRNETETVILELRNGNSIAPVNLTWSSGGKISSVTVGAPQNTYNKPKLDLFDRPVMSDCVESATHSCIHLSWLRRPCKGFGYVGFDKSDFYKARRLGLKTIQVKGYDVDVQINRKNNNQLFVNGLHPETTDLDLKEGIQESLEKDVHISFVNVVLCPPFETSNDDIQETEKELKKLCQDLLKTFVVEVKANKPKKDDIIMTAEVKVRSGSNLASQADALNSLLKIGGVGVKAKPIYYSNLFCNVKVLKVLEPRIQTSLKRFEEDLRHTEVNSGDELFRLDADTYDYLTAKLKLSAYREKIIMDLRKIVQNLLEGDIITPNDVSCIHKLFCHGGHMWLENLEKMENIHIIDEYKSKTIRLYGSQFACRNAALRIKEFLSSVEEEAVKHIVLSDGKDSRILLKAIIQNYGVDLKKFIDSTGLRSAELDIRKCQLTLHGSANSIEKAESELEKLADDFDSDCLTAIQSHQEICPVCLCPALTLTFRLENCGHLYCDACIKGLLSDAIPLKCCAQGCDKELILEDIRKVLDYDVGKINELQKKSLKDYIAQNCNFVYCPSPDCTMFVDKEKFRGAKWNCPLCHNDICIPCNTIYHHGYTCDMYQGMRKDSDYSFKVWKKTTSNCKMCPKCGSAIEKREGCNHMTCSNCHSHFCWLCLKAFRTGNEVYDHMPFCPKNQGR